MGNKAKVSADRRSLFAEELYKVHVPGACGEGVRPAGWGWTGPLGTRRPWKRFRLYLKMQRGSQSQVFIRGRNSSSLTEASISIFHALVA